MKNRGFIGVIILIVLGLCTLLIVYKFDVLTLFNHPVVQQMNTYILNALAVCWSWITRMVGILFT